MLQFAAITPHPPIIIPGIGQPEDLKKVSKTIQAMEKLAVDFVKIKPETVLIISPHAPMDYNGFLINSETDIKGSFIDFGLDQDFSFNNDYELMEQIGYRANNAGVPVHFRGSFLDHGALVPLYYLTQKIKPRLVHCAFSFLDFKTHLRYGEIIRNVIDEAKGRKIAVVASGDLSHRLIPGAPAGYSPKGQEFDQELIKRLNERDISGILEIEPNLIEAAGECGLRSIIILLGILGAKYVFNLLSYEGPFGVGYLVAELNLK